MIIEAGGGYRINSDVNSWRVERYQRMRAKKTKGWLPISYHADFKDALVYVADRRIRLIDSSVPDEIIAAIKQIKDEVISSAEVFREWVAQSDSGATERT